MALLRHDQRRSLDAVNHWLDRWPGWSPTDVDTVIRVDEFQEDGTWVIRADMAGIDPDKDVEITASDGMLHIRAERRTEEKTEAKDVYRQELRYGAFTRDLPLPEGCAEDAVTTAYKDGILEIRVPAPAAPVAKELKKVPVTKA